MFATSNQVEDLCLLQRTTSFVRLELENWEVDEGRRQKAAWKNHEGPQGGCWDMNSQLYPQRLLAG